MRSSHICGVVCLVVPLVAVLGCGGSEKGKKESSDSSRAKTRKVGKLDVGKLDKDRTVGPLDQGRIKVSPPEGWVLAPRRADKWLVRFKKFNDRSYPTILVTAEDYEATSNVSKENVAEFAKQIAAVPRTGKLTAPVEPIEIGSLVGVTYQQPAKTTVDYIKTTLDRVFVETVVSNRKYKIELHAVKGKAKQYEPQLYAVAGGIEFLEPGQPDQPNQPGNAKEGIDREDPQGGNGKKPTNDPNSNRTESLEKDPN